MKKTVKTKEKYFCDGCGKETGVVDKMPKGWAIIEKIVSYDPSSAAPLNFSREVYCPECMEKINAVRSDKFPINNKERAREMREEDES